MHRATHPVAAFLISGLLVLTGNSWAGPVQEADTRDAEQLAPPMLTGGVLGQVDTPELAASASALPASGSAESGAATSALAREVMKEAEADAHAAEQVRHARALARTQAASAAGGQARATDAEDDLNLREMGKAAVRWAKTTLPGLSDEADAEKNAHADQIQWVDTADAKSSETPTAAGAGKAAPRTAMSSDENFVRAAIGFIREVVGHPMTWLVVFLVVVGGIVAKKIDRRPTK